MMPFALATAVLTLGEAAPAAGDPFTPREYCALTALSPDMRTVRERWLDLNTLRAADPEVRAVRVAAEAFAGSATSIVERQITGAADPSYGSTGDVSGLNDDAISYHAGFYAQPLALAQAYACPHSALHGDPEVLAALNASLSFGARFFRLGMERPGNWWAWDIGAPMRISQTLLLAGDAVDPALRDGYVEALYYQGNQPRGLGFEKPGTGANAIWIAGNALRLALLTGDEPLMQRAAGIFADITQIKGEQGDGIMPDGSFHQHGNGINMGYGSAMLRDVAEYMYLTADTSFVLPATAEEAFTRFFTDYAVWDSYKGKFNPYSQGRAATRPGAFRSSVAAGVGVFLLNAGLAPARQAALAAINDCTGGDGEAALSLVPALTQTTARNLRAIRRAKPITGVRALPYSDMIISRSPAHFLSVRFAADTKGWFSIANENLKAHQVGEGSIVLLTDGRELEQDTAINQPWDALPGVTFCDGLRRPKETLSQSKLVGCASTANAGLIGGDYVLEDGERSLTGKKAYFLFGNLLVLLGSDLRATLGEPVVTTLYSNPLRDDGMAVLRGETVPVGEVAGPLTAGQGCFYRGSGMVLLAGEATASAESLRTTYGEVNARFRDEQHFENTYVRVTSAAPPGQAGSYAALVVAGVSAQQFARWLAAPPVRVESNAAGQGALRTDRRAGAFVAYEAGEWEAGGLSARGAVVWERVGDGVEIVVSRRNAEATTLRMTVPLPLKAPSVGQLIATAPTGSAIELQSPAGYVVEHRIAAQIGH